MSSPTTALVRKDRLWLNGFVALGTALAVFVLGERSFVRVFVVPDDDTAVELQAALVPVAVLLALVSSLHDVFRGTREYVLHRPVTAARVAATRHATALGLIGVWTLVATAWPWVGELLFGAGGACFDPARAAALVGLGLGLALDYALVSLALVVPASWRARVALAVLFLFGRYAVQSWAGAHDPSLAVVIAVLATATLATLAAAVRCGAEGHDADRPSRGPGAVAAAAAAILAASYVGAIAASGWDELALEGRRRGRPSGGSRRARSRSSGGRTARARARSSDRTASRAGAASSPRARTRRPSRRSRDSTRSSSWRSTRRPCRTRACRGSKSAGASGPPTTRCASSRRARTRDAAGGSRSPMAPRRPRTPNWSSSSTGRRSRSSSSRPEWVSGW
jgi:hypothetical protein